MFKAANSECLSVEPVIDLRRSSRMRPGSREDALDARGRSRRSKVLLLAILVTLDLHWTPTLLAHVGP